MYRKRHGLEGLLLTWRGDFAIDIPGEVFDLIYPIIVKPTTLAINRGKNQPVLTLTSRAGERQYLFLRKMILKKCLGNCAGGVHAVERCEVVVCKERPET